VRARHAVDALHVKSTTFDLQSASLIASRSHLGHAQGEHGGDWHLMCHAHRAQFHAEHAFEVFRLRAAIVQRAFRTAFMRRETAILASNALKTEKMRRAKR
jgi:hypothetical protein